MIILQTFNLTMKFISLLVIKIYQSFRDKFEVRAIFLDISKAFNKVWHKHLISKLKQNSVSCNILNTIDFLTFRKQSVVLNGQVSPWITIEGEVLQGSILEPLLFFVCINDLTSDLSTNIKLFAYDTLLFSLVLDINTSATYFSNYMRKISNRVFQWKMNLILDPSKQS